LKLKKVHFIKTTAVDDGGGKIKQTRVLKREISYPL